jgi:hypothetical protein
LQEEQLKNGMKIINIKLKKKACNEANKHKTKDYDKPYREVNKDKMKGYKEANKDKIKKKML